MSNRKAQYILLSYFARFPLRTLKADAYIRWLEVRKLVIDKQHLNAEGLVKVIHLSKLINDKSVVKRWKN